MSRARLFGATGAIVGALAVVVWAAHVDENRPRPPNQDMSTSGSADTSGSTAAKHSEKVLSPKDPVTARAVQVYGPMSIAGAIVCPNFELVDLMIDRYKEHFRAQIQEQVLGSQIKLLRGEPAPEPELSSYGCGLAPAGTILDRIKSFGPAVQIEGMNSKGEWIKGVTSILMIAPAESGSDEGRQEAKSNPAPSENEKQPELPDLANTPDLDCSTEHRGCTDQEFANVLADLRRQWAQMPSSIQSACRTNETASGMEDCILVESTKWQNAHFGESAPWINNIDRH